MALSTARHVDATVSPLLTDKYQLSMAYGYFQLGRHKDHAIFDLFFRKSPFKGEFTIFAGLESCLDFLRNFKFYPSDIEYLKTTMPDADDAFWAWLSELDTTGLEVYAMSEGTVCFGREVLMRIQGPLALCQLLETTLLNLCNFASLVTTNAARMVQAAGTEKKLAEFGLRRAQGPDGAMTASYGAFLGGFHSTSNMAAGKKFGIPTVGTMAHAFICSFSSLDDLPCDMIKTPFVETVLQIRSELNFTNTNNGELAAFIGYAMSYPKSFLALIDTYDTLKSGLLNFIVVGLALLKSGYKPLGIRLDSGDLAYLSKEVRRLTTPHFGHINIVASNDLNEDIIHSLNSQGHEIDTFGIGTNLVTCQAQPALGMVYKLVEIKSKPCIKVSEEVAKITMPGRKEVYRLFGADGIPLMDFITCGIEPTPVVGERILARNPIKGTDRAYVTPSRVEKLLKGVFRGGKSIVEGSGIAPTFWCAEPVPLVESRAFVQAQLAIFPNEHLRQLNPTPFKLMVSPKLFAQTEGLLMEALPAAEFA
jgi:nicotinate phosphoribosyltransferase